MKKSLPKIIAIILAAFGLLTLFLSSSVIFDLFGIRVKQGNYVLFVVWSNFISSLLYLFAAYGFVKTKKWTAPLLGISTIILIASFIGLIIYVNSGGLHETKTIGALIFRIAVTLIFAILAYFIISKKNMKTKIISIIAVSLFLFSCGNNSKENSKEQTETVSQEGLQQDKKTQALELNNGEKWKVNDEMMPPIHNMEKDINAFVTAEQKDYKSLAEELQKNIDLLISSCTMKGKSHDELHKWLHPYLELVNELSNANSEEEANQMVNKLQLSFETFNIYFQ